MKAEALPVDLENSNHTTLESSSKPTAESTLQTTVAQPGTLPERAAAAFTPTETSDDALCIATRFNPKNYQIETRLIPIDAICQSDELNIRDYYPPREIELLENKIRYKREKLPPIVLFLVGNIYYVVDGVYRLLAYKRAGCR
jgi:hypothetical protein